LTQAQNDLNKAVTALADIETQLNQSLEESEQLAEQINSKKAKFDELGENELLKDIMQALEKSADITERISVSDLKDLAQIKKPGDTQKILMDAVQILMRKPLRNDGKTKTYNIMNHDFTFYQDSYSDHTRNLLADPKTFVNDLKDFTLENKDSLDEETIELLQPYFELLAPNGEPIFNEDCFKRASPTLMAIFSWM
jgi:hypothetical protein